MCGLLMKTDSELLEEIYWLIGRADPTADDIRGAAIQISWLIEQFRPEIAKKISERHLWPYPFFKKEWPYLKPHN